MIAPVLKPPLWTLKQSKYPSIETIFAPLLVK